jgi:transcription elongation factor GreA
VQHAGKRAFLAGGLETGGGDHDALKRERTLVRFADKVRAVEQQARAGGIRFACKCAVRAHDRILATVDSLHALLPHGPYVKVEFTVKDRLLKRFTDEIAALERELKVDLPREIQRAREYGDLRENAEYKAAKERQGIVDARISMLKKRVSEIQLMNLDRIPRDKAAFGSTVQLRASDGALLVYQLVMPEDADAEKGMISTASPIGRAILNKEEGDEIKVITPSGTKTFELVKLSTIHDSDS